VSLTTSQTSLASGRLESILGLWCHRCIAGGFSIVGVRPGRLGSAESRSGMILCLVFRSGLWTSFAQVASIRVGKEIMMWYVYQDYKTPLFEFLYLKHVTLIRSVWEIPSYFLIRRFLHGQVPAGRQHCLAKPGSHGSFWRSPTTLDAGPRGDGMVMLGDDRLHVAYRTCILWPLS